MIQSFFDRGTEDIFNRVRSKAARRACPDQLWAVARRKLDQLNAVVSLESLRIPPGNQLEALRRDRKGQYSIRSTTSTACVSFGTMTVQDAWR